MVHIMSTAVISAVGVTSNLVAVGAIALSPPGAALGQARARAAGSSLPAVAEGVPTDLLSLGVAARRAATMQGAAEGVLVDLPPREAGVVALRAAAVQEAAVARRAGVTTDGMAGEKAGFGL